MIFFGSSSASLSPLLSPSFPLSALTFPPPLRSFFFCRFLGNLINLAVWWHATAPEANVNADGCFKNSRRQGAGKGEEWGKGGCGEGHILRSWAVKAVINF